MVDRVADRVAVLRKGAIVELGLAAEVFRNPQQEYTRALIDSVPVPDPAAARV